MTTDQNGAEVPVDLSLKSTGDGFTPAEPLVGLTLPDDLGHEVALGDRGITIDIGATDASAARSAGAQSLNGEGLFYTEAAPATDVLLAPYSLGLKAIYQLRAPQSPEHLPMRLTLPDGASLEATGDRGAWALKGDRVLAYFDPPVATDAAGNPVAATMKVNSGSLELDVSHADPAITYPIAVTTTSFTSTAVNPQLGYNTIQAGDDQASNWSFAHDEGKATWARIPARRGDWAVLKFDSAVDNGLVPLIFTPFPEGCYDGASVCSPTESASAYANKCRNLASTYGGGYASYEVMNEPNHDHGASWGGSPLRPATYASYFVACYDAIKQVRPNAPVLAGSVVRTYSDALGMDWWEYEQTFGNNAAVKQRSWIISSHLYPNRGSCQYFNTVSDMEVCMGNSVSLDLGMMPNAGGSYDRPLWATEFGIKDAWLSCDTKRSWLAEGFVWLDNQLGIPRVFVYRFTRNRAAFWNDPSLAIDHWAEAGVYDSTFTSGDPDDQNGYYNGYQYCGLYQLAANAG